MARPDHPAAPLTCPCCGAALRLEFDRPPANGLPPARLVGCEAQQLAPGDEDVDRIAALALAATRPGPPPWLRRRMAAESNEAEPAAGGRQGT